MKQKIQCFDVQYENKFPHETGFLTFSLVLRICENIENHKGYINII